MSGWKLQRNWFKVVPKTEWFLLNQNPGIDSKPEILKTMTPSAAKEIKEASDSKFFSDQFVSLKHITHSGIRETEAGY